jgi:hypothetical protein
MRYREIGTEPFRLSETSIARPDFFFKCFLHHHIRLLSSVYDYGTSSFGFGSYTTKERRDIDFLITLGDFLMGGDAEDD